MEDIAAIAAKYINNTGRNIFLTGKAGTGKTTFLKNLIAHTYKNAIVVAPTGIAAINAGGVTIHSQFQVPFGSFVPTNNFDLDQSRGLIINTPSSVIKQLQMHNTKRKVLREMELLIIDEVSMLRADLLDAIDAVLKSIRRNKTQPFGGAQVLFIGDLLQLPPVIKREEWRMLQHFYKSIYFFDAYALKEHPPLYIELDKIYRQTDSSFISVLNELRNNELSEQSRSFLNKQFNPSFRPAKEDNYIFLTTHNRKADKINQQEIENLTTRSRVYKASIHADYPESMYPIPPEILLKEGAQVMFIKNDYSGKNRYFNGKIGTVIELEQDRIMVDLNDGSEPIEVEKYEWENKMYKLNDDTGEIEEKIKGSFTQYPIRLAWAITVHKSQGLTFDRAILDLEDVFAPGQMYVALSRLTSINGLVLATEIQAPKHNSDGNLIGFMSQKSSSAYLNQSIDQDTNRFLVTKAYDVFNFEGLIYELRKFISSFNKETNRSKKQLDAVWANELLNTTLPIEKVGKNFMHEIARTAQEAGGVGDRLLQRSLAAKGYFEPLFEEQIKQIDDRIKHWKGEKAVKTYLTELKDLHSQFSLRLLKIERLIKFLKAIVEKKEFKRDEAVEIKKHEIKSKSKGPKTPTHKITLELHKARKSIQEISKERELGITTIEGHLAKCVGEGLIEYTEFITEDDLLKIRATSKKLETKNLTPIKEALREENFSYFQIKVAISQLKE